MLRLSIILPRSPRLVLRQESFSLTAANKTITVNWTFECQEPTCLRFSYDASLSYFARSHQAGFVRRIQKLSELERVLVDIGALENHRLRYSDSSIGMQS